MEFIDTHCHVHFKDYEPDAEEVLKASARAGVTRLICVGCSLADSQAAVEFANAHDNVWASAGAHPHDGADFLTDKDAGDKLKSLLASPRVVAVGEIGLDYYHENTPRADQLKSLRAQLEIAAEHDLPIIFHVRDAWKDFWPLIDDFKIKQAVIHSFSAGPRQLEAALSRDFFVGLNGIMTFTRDESQLEAARAVPLDKLLLETDAPFLTPVPFRGQRCEPKHVRNIADFLAELRAENIEDLASRSTANALKLFGLGDEK